MAQSIVAGPAENGGRRQPDFTVGEAEQRAGATSCSVAQLLLQLVVYATGAQWTWTSSRFVRAQQPVIRCNELPQCHTATLAFESSFSMLFHSFPSTKCAPPLQLHCSQITIRRLTFVVSFFVSLSLSLFGAFAPSVKVSPPLNLLSMDNIWGPTKNWSRSIKRSERERILMAMEGKREAKRETEGGEKVCRAGPHI